MYKIFAFIRPDRSVEASIIESYLDNCPTDKFMEVSDPTEADAVFMFGNLSETHTSIEFGPHTLDNNSETMALSKALEDKCRIVWLDSLGPTVASAHTPPNYKDYLRDNDIPVSASSLPNHPNKQEHVYHIESSVFHPMNRFERKKRSAVIMYDQLTTNIEVVKDVLPNIDKLFVTRTDDLGEISQDPTGKLNYSNVNYPFGVRKILSQYEYVLSINDWCGMEMMGFEGGFCGAHPIYPDTAYYRDLFIGFEGIRFFNTHDAANSISAIINTESDWIENHMDAFVSKFSAETNLPDFWNNVDDVLNRNESNK